MTKSTFKILFTVAVLGSIFGRVLAWGVSPIVGSAPVQPALTPAEARGDFSGDDAGSVTAAKLQVCANALPTVDEVDAWRAIETRRLLLQKIVNAGASLLNDYLPTLADPTTAAPTQATVVAEFQSLLNAGGLA